MNLSNWLTGLYQTIANDKEMPRLLTVEVTILLASFFAVALLKELRSFAMKPWQIHGRRMGNGCLPFLCCISYEGIPNLLKNQTLQGLTTNSNGLAPRSWEYESFSDRRDSEKVLHYSDKNCHVLSVVMINFAHFALLMRLYGLLRRGDEILCYNPLKLAFLNV